MSGGSIWGRMFCKPYQDKRMQTLASPPLHLTSLSILGEDRCAHLNASPSPAHGTPCSLLHLQCSPPHHPSRPQPSPVLEEYFVNTKSLLPAPFSISETLPPAPRHLACPFTSAASTWQDTGSSVEHPLEPSGWLVKQPASPTGIYHSVGPQLTVMHQSGTPLRELLL